MLDDHAHRVPERALVDGIGTEQQQRPGPVDRLGDARGLLQIELADLVDDLNQLAGDLVIEIGGVQPDDLELVLEFRVIKPQVQAAPLERLGQLASVVRSQQHHGLGPRLDPAELRDRDLEVAEQLEQHRLELLVGLVDLVDQQHDRLRAGDRGHQRSRQQELLAEDVVLDVLPTGAIGLGLDPEQLLAVVPLVQRLGLVEALVALQADQRPLQVARQRLRQLGLTDARRALDKHRLTQLRRQERDERRRSAGQIPDLAKALGDVLHRCGVLLHRSNIGFGVWRSSSSRFSRPIWGSSSAAARVRFRGRRVRSHHPFPHPDPHGDPGDRADQRVLLVRAAAVGPRRSPSALRLERDRRAARPGRRANACDRPASRARGVVGWARRLGGGCVGEASGSGQVAAA